LLDESKQLFEVNYMLRLRPLDRLIGARL